MKLFINHYKVLDIDRNADNNAIKKAYRKLALKFHPDVCSLSHAQVRFIEIQEAYEILGDINKRHYYNILFDKHYQPKEAQQPETVFEAEVQRDYQEWKKNANSTAINLSKEKFAQFRDNVFEKVGSAYKETVDFTSNMLAIAVVCLIFGGVFVNWTDYQNGSKESIYGVIICSFLSLLILFFTILSIRKKMKDE